MKHIKEQPPPLPADVPPNVRELIEITLAKDPASGTAPAARSPTRSPPCAPDDAPRARTMRRPSAAPPLRPSRP